MRVCILTHTFPRFTGDSAAPFMEGLVNGMVANGNEVFVLTPFDPGFKEESRNYHLVTYRYAFLNSWHKLGYSQTLKNDMQIKPLMLILSPLMIICGIFALWKLVKEKKIEVINAHWILPNGFIASVVSLITGVPVISTLPGSDVYLVFKNPIFRIMAKFAASTSKVITSNSPQLLKDLSKLGIDENKFKTIVYGVDPSKFKPDLEGVDTMKVRWKIDKKRKIVLAVGRLVAKKGFRYLIEAVRNVIKEFKNVTFLIIGEGDQRPELEQLIKKNDLEEYIKLPGAISYDELKVAYNCADIFILPSIRDENGNLDDQSVSVVEAMSCGKPIITTDFPGYRNVVRNDFNGYLVNEKNPQEIANALLKILKEHRLQEKMGKNSRELVLEKFAWNKIGKSYSQLFKEVIP